MGLLDSFEQGLERAVNRAFAKTFRSGIQPVEIASALRRELNSLVAMHHHRTGKPHGMVHNELRTKCGGPPVAQASEEQLNARLAMLQRWFIGRK